MSEHTSLTKGREILATISQWQLRQLLEYWIKIHPIEQLPGRQHLDPMDIPKTLPHIVMTDVEYEPFRLKFRLLGTHVTEAFGKDVTGRYFDEEFQEYQDTEGYNQRKLVAETGEPIHFLGQGKLKYNLDHKYIEWVLLPLASDGKRVNKIISAISYGGA